MYKMKCLALIVLKFKIPVDRSFLWPGRLPLADGNYFWFEALILKVRKFIAAFNFWHSIRTWTRKTIATIWRIHNTLIPFSIALIGYYTDQSECPIKWKFRYENEPHQDLDNLTSRHWPCLQLDSILSKFIPATSMLVTNFGVTNFWKMSPT